MLTTLCLFALRLFQCTKFQVFVAMLQTTATISLNKNSFSWNLRCIHGKIQSYIHTYTHGYWFLHIPRPAVHVSFIPITWTQSNQLGSPPDNRIFVRAVRFAWNFLGVGWAVGCREAIYMGRRRSCLCCLHSIRALANETWAWSFEKIAVPDCFVWHAPWWKLRKRDSLAIQEALDKFLHSEISTY